MAKEKGLTRQDNSLPARLNRLLWKLKEMFIKKDNKPSLNIGTVIPEKTLNIMKKSFGFEFNNGDREKQKNIIIEKPSNETKIPIYQGKEGRVISAHDINEALNNYRKGVFEYKQAIQNNEAKKEDERDL